MKNAVKTKILFVLEIYIDHHASIPQQMWGSLQFGALFALENNIILLKEISNQLLAHLVTVMWRSKWKFWPPTEIWKYVFCKKLYALECLKVCWQLT